MKAHSHHIFDVIMNQPNGCVYTQVNNHNCQNHPKKREGRFSLSWLNDERHAQKNTTCGNCQKALGKGSRKQPSIWCNVCGWVHHKCSGLTTVTGYAKNRGENFLCSKCSRTRRLLPATQEAIAYSKLHNLHNIYTSCQSPASFGSRRSLKKESNCTFKQVHNFLRKSETYTNFKQARRNFTRLKVQSHRLNEIWSIDLPDMQQLSEFNQGITFPFVAVDKFSRFVWVVPLKQQQPVDKL